VKRQSASRQLRLEHFFGRLLENSNAVFVLLSSSSGGWRAPTFRWDAHLLRAATSRNVVCRFHFLVNSRANFPRYKVEPLSCVLRFDQ
jgi:hypothetical protein